MLGREVTAGGAVVLLLVLTAVSELSPHSSTTRREPLPDGAARAATVEVASVEAARGDGTWSKWDWAALRSRFAFNPRTAGGGDVDDTSSRKSTKRVPTPAPDAEDSPSKPPATRVESQPPAATPATEDDTAATTTSAPSHPRAAGGVKPRTLVPLPVAELDPHAPLTDVPAAVQDAAPVPEHYRERNDETTRMIKNYTFVAPVRMSTCPLTLFEDGQRRFSLNVTFWRSFRSYVKLKRHQEQMLAMYTKGRAAARGGGGDYEMAALVNMSMDLVNVVMSRHPYDGSVSMPFAAEFNHVKNCAADVGGAILRWYNFVQSRKPGCADWLVASMEWIERLFWQVRTHALPLVNKDFKPKHFFDLGSRDYSHEIWDHKVHRPWYKQWGGLGKRDWEHTSTRFFFKNYPGIEQGEVTFDAFEVDAKTYAETYVQLNEDFVGVESKMAQPPPDAALPGEAADAGDSATGSVRGRRKGRQQSLFTLWPAAAWLHNDGLIVRTNDMMTPGVFPKPCAPNEATKCACFPTVDIIDLLRRHRNAGDVAMKMDIEGGEWVLIEHMIRTGIIPHRVKEIYLECHPPIVPILPGAPQLHGMHADIFRRLGQFGWDCMLMLDVLRSLGVAAYPWP